MLVVAWSLMFSMASEREHEELSVFSSLPVATVKEAAWVGCGENRKMAAAIVSAARIGFEDRCFKALCFPHVYWVLV